MSYFNYCFTKNIISRIHVKLQYIDLILPDQDYLDFIEDLENFEKFTAGLEDTSYITQIELSSARKRFANITERQKILSELLEVKKGHLEKTSSESLYIQFLNEIEASINWATEDIENFREEIAKCCKKIYDIKQLIRILNTLRDLKFSLSVVLNNFINWVKLASVDNIKDILSKIYTRACSNIEVRTKLVCKSFAPPKSSGRNPNQFHKKRLRKEKMDETVKKEVDARRKDVSVNKTDLTSLKKSLFTSDISLATRERRTKSEIEQKAQTARSHLDSIAELEGRIDSMDEQLSQITINKEETESKIKTLKQQLEDTIVELIRLEALLDDINAEIRQKSSIFQAQMDAYEQKRQDILNDENTTEEQKAALIENLNRDIVDAKAKHKESMHALEVKRTDIQRMSQKRTESLLSLKQGVKEEYTDEIEKLQQKKLHATDSDVLQLDEKIKKLKKDLKEDMQSCQRFRAGWEEEFDEYGEEEEESAVQQPEESKSVVSQSEISPADSSIDMSKMGNAEYIRHTVGKPLARALAMICIQQPEDPITYLADYFLQYHYNQQRNRELVKGFDELLLTRDYTNE